MNNIISWGKDSAPIFGLIAMLALLFVPLPAFGIGILLTVDMSLAVFVFAVMCLCQKEPILFFYRMILIFCAITLATAIATTRTFLVTENLNDQITVIRIVGQWICRENFVCGFFTTLLMSMPLFLSQIAISRRAEIFGRACIDNMNQKFWQIGQQLKRNEITNDEAQKKKRAIQYQIEYQSQIQSAAKLLLGMFKAFIGIFLVDIAGGMALGILKLNLTWQESLERYIMLSCGYLFVFNIPQLLVCLGIQGSLKKQC